MARLAGSIRCAGMLNRESRLRLGILCIESLVDSRWVHIPASGAPINCECGGHRIIHNQTCVAIAELSFLGLLLGEQVMVDRLLLHSSAYNRHRRPSSSMPVPQVPNFRRKLQPSRAFLLKRPFSASREMAISPSPRRPKPSARMTAPPAIRVSFSTVQRVRRSAAVRYLRSTKAHLSGAGASHNR